MTLMMTVNENKSRMSKRICSYSTKAKAAGMKKGDKFKVGDKEYTLEDMEKLVDTMKNKDVQEKSNDYIDLDKDGNKTDA